MGLLRWAFSIGRIQQRSWPARTGNAAFLPFDRRRLPGLGDNRDRNPRPFRELHNCTVSLGDATRRPTPDAELPALSAGVVGAMKREPKPRALFARPRAR
jgi:hypothetical protein